MAKEAAPPEMSFWEAIADSITGSRRVTPETMALPEYTGMPELNRFSLPSFRSALGTVITSPEETVKVLLSNFPELRVRQDSKGNYILRSSINNREYAIPPGFSVGDIPRALAGLASVVPAGLATTIPRAAAVAAGNQAAFEASQALTGGSFDPDDVAIAGTIGAAFPALGAGAKAAIGAARKVLRRSTPQQSFQAGGVTRASNAIAASKGAGKGAADPLLLRTLAAEANRTPFTAKANKGMADPSQAFTDVERMAKEYGYEGLMNPQQGTAILYKPTPVQRYSWGGVVQQPHGVVSPYNTTPDMADGGRIYPDNELNNYAAGGLAHFNKGGAVKTIIKDLMKKVLNEQGSFEAKRLERAADEVPNLESLYQQEALERLFRGDNARALMTMNPKDFEKFSQPLDPRFMDENSTRYTKTGERMSFPEYMTEYLPNVGAFSDVPFLEINKQKQGSKSAPFISGHEGRHRNRVMADRGETAGLVQLLPRSELREPFPRRSREEYIEALTKELELTGGMILPERFEDQASVIRRRPAIKLPKVYAKGGEAHFNKGGAVKPVKEGLKKAIKGALKVLSPAEGIRGADMNKRKGGLAAIKRSC